MSLSISIEKYLRKQPKDEEFEFIIDEMTLSNFSSQTIESFFEKIFNNNESDIKKLSIPRENPNEIYKRQTYLNQSDCGSKLSSKNLEQIDDQEFEDALDDFIKGLKDL